MGTETGPPKQIWYSLSAFLGTIVVVLIFLVFSAFRYGMKLDRSETMISLLEAAIIVLLMLLMLRRKKWARTVYTVLTGLVVLGVFVAMLVALVGGGPVKKALPLGAYNLAALALQAFLRLLSVYFLFVRQSREWFRPLFMERDVVPGSEGESNTRSPMKKCPFCAEEIQAEAVKCRHCGSMLGANPFSHDDARSVVTNKVRIALRRRWKHILLWLAAAVVTSLFGGLVALCSIVAVDSVLVLGFIALSIALFAAAICFVVVACMHEFQCSYCGKTNHVAVFADNKECTKCKVLHIVDWDMAISAVQKETLLLETDRNGVH